MSFLFDYIVFGIPAGTFLFIASRYPPTTWRRKALSWIGYALLAAPVILRAALAEFGE